MFKIDSPLMNFLNKVADVIILNLLFIVFCIPVFTIGASFSAAYYVGFKMAKDEETYIIKSFWKSFRENFRQATGLWLIMLVIMGILILDLRIIAYSGIDFAQWIRIGMVAVTFILLLGAVFVFPLQARFVNPIKNTIKNAFLMALSHLPSAIALIVLYAAPVMLVYFVPQSVPVVVFMGFGAIFYAQSSVLLKIFKKYEDALVDQSQAGGRGENEQNGDEGIFAESDRIEKGDYSIVAEGAEPAKVFRDGRFVDLSQNSGDKGDMQQ